MNSIFKTIIIYLILNTIYLMLIPSPIHAQSLSLSISPPILELIIKPGKSITQAYTLSNFGDPVVVTPRLVELTETGDRIKESNDFEREKWISILSNQYAFDKPFLLLNGETRQLILRINPPVGTAEKDYYRVLLFTTTPGPVSEFSQSSVSTNLGSVLLVNVTATGMVNKSAQVIRFDIPKILDSFTPLTADIEVKNTGNTFFRPIGTINLSGPIGRGSYKLSPNVILAGQSKRIAVEETFMTPYSNHSIYLPGLFIGKYLMETSFTLDEGTIRVASSRSFYALPWKATLVLIGFVILIRTVIRWMKRMR